MLTIYGSSREEDEARARLMAESLRSFSEELYLDIKSKLQNDYVNLSRYSQGYEISFNVRDGMTLCLSGSDTQNGDCFFVFLKLGDSFPLVEISDRAPLSEFKEKLSKLCCALAGQRVSFCERLIAHKGRELSFYTLSASSEPRLVYSKRTLSGLSALLLLWKSSESETYFDLSYNEN